MAEKVAEIDEIIWYAKHRQTCTQTHQRVCVQVRQRLFATLKAIYKETKPELTWATKIISKYRKIVTIAHRLCAMWYVTLDPNFASYVGNHP